MNGIVDRVQKRRGKYSVDKKTRRVKRSVKKEAARADEVSVYISPLMFVMALIFVAFGMAYEFVCSLTAVILHEFAHAKIARRLGYALNRIKIMPYGAALCGKADICPSHEIAIAAAGPIFNIVLAVIFAALWWLVPSSYMFTETFCRCNLYIGLFNLLPVYPLDGGRIALGLFSIKLRRKKAYKIIRIVSGVIGVISLCLFALSAVYALNICFLTVGVFMIVSALLPDSRAEYYALFALGNRRARLSKPIEVRTYAVNMNAQLSELTKNLDPDRYCVFNVLDDDFNTVFKIDETALISAVKDGGYGGTVKEIHEKTKKIEIA